MTTNRSVVAVAQFDSAQLTLTISESSAGPTTSQVSYYEVVPSGSLLIFRPTSSSLPADTGSTVAGLFSVRTHLSSTSPVQSFAYLNVTGQAPVH